MDCSSSGSSIVDRAVETSSIASFQCCVCLDLLYKPVVLACGHISCFWCINKAMHGLQASRCAICRQKYFHFPSICQLLHFLLLKLEPLVYKLREKEMLDEEKLRNCFSPQFEDHLTSEKFYPGNVASEENDSPKSGLHDGTCKQISLNDLLCAGCKELLYRPSVLNCGHVYCESCMPRLVNGPFKCQVCHSLHPGNYPKVCLELDQFLEEQFPKEYAIRREEGRYKILQGQHGDPQISIAESQKQISKTRSYDEEDNPWLNEDLTNTNVGVGCDSCGMFPIIGQRYKCRDCKEKIGFDLCQICYKASSKLPGRFNQQHAPDHRFELDESRLLSKILLKNL